MAMEVLRPHDVLMAQQMRHIPAILPSPKPKRNPNPKPSRKPPSPRPEARKRREASVKPAKTGEGKRPAVAHVTILKRGEPLDAFRNPEAEAAPVFGTGRMGPDPEMIPKQIGTGGLKAAAAVYAGSAFSVSPSPSSLPLPSFSVKKEEVPAIVDYATKDLRRLLHLE
ncbi:uncharacterized protein LOC103720945 [Phoenix dactylifera]|uniref:Uncharacterized protein LOC103720945 n=1 Tax=Phoenix dactylifera TaxID=42345 RepID=A0A8B7CY75_PHODC|nr:uncharacterized protein LOC103720945 [Phoenix dactylifera]